MKKLLAFVLLTVMLVSMVPVLSSTLVLASTTGPSTGPKPTTAYVPPNTGTPPVIKAKWEAPDSADPSHSIPGTQVKPPMTHEGISTVTYCLVITDRNGKDNIATAWVDIIHPDGTFKYQIELTEVDTSTPQARQAAADKIQSAYDNDTLKFNMEYNLADVLNETLQNSAKLYCGDADLDYHQMCGDYTVMSYAYDAQGSRSDFFNNTFEYVCMAGIQLDFNAIDFGEVVQSSFKWVEGDELFNLPVEGGKACNNGPDIEDWNNCGKIGGRQPTLRNIGNTPVYIEVEFDDMGFGQQGQPGEEEWNVQFDASLKHDEEIIFDPYVATRLPDNGVEPEPYCEEAYAVLDLCDTEKISFSIHIKKAVDLGETYTGDVIIEPVPMSYPWWPPSCEITEDCAAGQECVEGYCCIM